MDEKEILQQSEQHADNTDRKREIRELLNELLPESDRSDDVDEMMRNYINNSEGYRKEQENANERISAAIAQEPIIARAFIAMVNGGKSEAARTLVRHLGQEFFNAEEGSPEYDAISQADEDYRKELESLKQADDTFNKNFDESWNTIVPFCEQHGINPDKFEDDIWQKILEPLLQGNFNHELLLMLKKALDYDKDTEDAFAAGEVKGRNENINKMRSQQSDGLPKGLGTQATQSERPKRKVNPLIEAALNA